MNKKFWLILPLVFLMAALLTIDPLHKKEKAGLRVEYPAGTASIFLNDQYLNQAPSVNSEILAGNYILRITPDNEELAGLTTPISLERGTMTVLIYNPGENTRMSSSTILELHKLEEGEQKLAKIHFETYPENAFVSIDGGEVQFSPLDIELDPGEHHFLVNLPSYEAQEHSIRVLSGYQTVVSVSLAKIANPEKVELKSSESELIQERYNQDLTEATSSAEILGPKLKILHTNYFVGQAEVLKVRTEASPTAEEIGYAKVGYYYPFLEEKLSEENELWYRIQFHNASAWIKASYAELIKE